MTTQYFEILGNIFKEKIAAILESDQAKLERIYENETKSESVVKQQKESLGDKLTKAYNTLCFELKRERILGLRDENLLIISFDLILFYLNPENSKDTTTEPPFCKEFAKNCINFSQLRQNNSFENLYCENLEELVRHVQTNLLINLELRDYLKVDEYLLCCSEASQKTEKTLVDQILSQSFLRQQELLIQEDLCQRLIKQEFVRQEYLASITKSSREDEEMSQIFEAKVANDYERTEEKLLADKFENAVKMPKSILKVSKSSAFSPLQKKSEAHQGESK